MWLLTGAVLFAGGLSAEVITLKDEVYIKGPKVLLGDVADIEGEGKTALESVELATAALPGDCRRLDAALVVARVKNAGMDFQELEVKGARTVLATTLHQEMSPAQIAESLRSFVEGSMPWDVLDTEVDVVPPAQGIVVPDGVLDITWRPSPQYQYVGTGTFRGQVSVDGRTQDTLTCRAVVEPYIDIVVAKGDIPRGKPLTSNDLAMEKHPVSNAKGGVFRSPADLEGYVARTTLLSGQIVTERYVMPRTIVHRNQIVNVETTAGGLVLQGRACVRMDACAGDIVQCTNLDSKQDFQGVVRKDGVVLVP